MERNTGANIWEKSIHEALKSGKPSTIPDTVAFLKQLAYGFCVTYLKKKKTTYSAKLSSLHTPRDIGTP